MWRFFHVRHSESVPADKILPKIPVINCIGLLVFASIWVTSYHCIADARFGRYASLFGSQEIFGRMRNGILKFGVSTADPPYRTPWKFEARIVPGETGDNARRTYADVGVGDFQIRQTVFGPYTIIFTAPFWAVFAVTSLPTMRWATKRSVYALHRRSRSTEFCSKCGYDVRAAPSCCPECGTATPVRKPANSS